MVWDTYPLDYRSEEINAVINAALSGDSVSLVGLSGAGKSNLVGFLANRWGDIAGDDHNKLEFTLVDCNQITDKTPNAFYKSIRLAMGDKSETSSESESLGDLLNERCQSSDAVQCILFDRFDYLGTSLSENVANNLRAFRDQNKYKLSYVIATRHELDGHSELSELFYGSSIWLGSLSASNASWSARSFADRKNLNWEDAEIEALIEISQGYPSMLRAVCEAYADISTLDADKLITHPAVQRRVTEFWADNPTDEEIKLSGLSDHPLLMAARPHQFDTTALTAKEHVLLNYFISHPNTVCEKNDLIEAVWPEDKIYTEGVRDDSLAQLVRRLRKKLEKDPSKPRYFQTAPGRGYRFTP